MRRGRRTDRWKVITGRKEREGMEGRDIIKRRRDKEVKKVDVEGRVETKRKVRIKTTKRRKE